MKILRISPYISFSSKALLGSTSLTGLWLAWEDLLTRDTDMSSAGPNLWTSLMKRALICMGNKRNKTLSRYLVDHKSVLQVRTSNYFDKFCCIKVKDLLR